MNTTSRTAYPPEFSAALAHTLEWEGGYVDHPSDPGGATNHGISLRFLRARGETDLYDSDGDGDLDATDIKALTREDAAALYYQHFWLAGEYDLLPASIRPKVFDTAVNVGAKQAARILQRAINACGLYCVDDGIIGTKTRQAAYAIDAPILIAALRATQAGFYRALVAKRRSLATFLRGWLRRANA